jgi:hypothetical protein
MLRRVNDGVTIIKPGHQTTGNACVLWSHESSFTLFPTSRRVCIWRTPKEAYNLECLVPPWNTGDFLWWFRHQYYGTVFCWSITTLHGRITAREYGNRLGNQVHPMILTLFPNNNSVFQDNSAPCTQLELCSHGLKSIDVNFSILPGQHNHQILT